MTTTTSYGTWNNRVESGDLTVEQTITVALGDYTHEYDLDAIAADYRNAINEALPEGVSLNGDEFYGPYYAADRDFDGYSTDEDDRLDVKAIVEGIDFWEIASRHEITNTEDHMPLTLVSAATGDQVPGVEISSPDSPIAWADLPVEAQQWATEQGYGEDDSELLYVLTAEDGVPDGFASYTVHA